MAKLKSIIKLIRLQRLLITNKKICIKCNILKAISNFSKDKQKIDGYRSYKTFIFF